MKAPKLQAILAELFNHFVRDMLERNSIDKSEAKLQSKNTVNLKIIGDIVYTIKIKQS